MGTVGRSGIEFGFDLEVRVGDGLQQLDAVVAVSIGIVRSSTRDDDLQMPVALDRVAVSNCVLQAPEGRIYTRGVELIGLRSG